MARWAERAARSAITAGGLFMIACLLLIFVLILAAALPLFRPGAARLERTTPFGAGGAPLVAGLNEYRDVADAVFPDGSIRAVDLVTGATVKEVRLPEAGGSPFSAASRTLKQEYALGLPDGRILFATGRWRTRFAGESRSVELDVTAERALAPDPLGRPARRLAGEKRENGALVVAASPDPSVLLYAFWSEEDGEGAVDLSRELSGERISALFLTERAERLCVGTESGKVVVFSLESLKEPVRTDAVFVDPVAPAPVTALGALVGGQTLLVGDARGRVLGFAAVRERPDAEERRMRPVRLFEPHVAPVAALAASPRGKTFASADADGNVLVRYGTNERTLARARASGAASSLAVAPKGNGFLAATPSGFDGFSLDAPHPEFSWRALFGKVWYEGHDRPEYVWQSSGATDDFEPKLSLVPLVFGTLKGTVYALLFAVPVAIAAAFYTSVFAHRSIRAIVKPAVELMAALPSVVVGFVAGLWLSPLLERATLATLLLVPGVPLFVLAAVLLWQLVPFDLRKRVRPGSELILIMAVTLLAVWASGAVAPTLERTLFSGDFKAWLFSAMGLSYDTRNCLVIGLAMGFAVIPIIFTIAEDALSSVPDHLKAASLALGASLWQTAVRVIFPTAAAGIFSAVMVGFGRAAGETMIVLMATGNTPILEWSIFNGMRTLSANVAVEIPEAPQGGTLYRVLFLGALLLFLMTFVVNTLAELLRQRFRKKYAVI